MPFVTSSNYAMVRLSPQLLLLAQWSAQCLKRWKSCLPQDSVRRSKLLPFLYLHVITERGDKKKAITRLRAGATQKSHHFSTFRTGMWLGLSIPATVAGLTTCTSCFPDADVHGDSYVTCLQVCVRVPLPHYLHGISYFLSTLFC